MFDKSSALADRLIVLPETGSTNDDLAALARDVDSPATEFTVVVTDSQTAGRGRLGRTWIASSGKTLAISILVRPESLFETPNRLAWLPLISGLAMTEAIQRELDILTTAPVSAVDATERELSVPRAALKWPNDVLINGFKVSGILTELLPDQRAVVIGSGVNLTLDEHDLPTLTSTSVLLATGQAPNADRLLAAYLVGLRARYDLFLASAGDAASSGLRDEMLSVCGTLGSAVRVELPGERELLGEAVTIDESGQLVVRTRDGDTHAVSAGDVTHLRLDA